MHPIYDDLYFITALIYLTPIVIILLLAMIIWCLVDFARKTPVKYKAAKYSVIAVCFAGLLYVLPFGFHYLSLYSSPGKGLSPSTAYSEKEKIQMVKYSKLAVQTSVLPSVKSYMYSELGLTYANILEGNKAIEAYEKVKGISNIYPANVHLCSLYTIKGDYAKSIKACELAGAQQYVAIYYILQDNYPEALNQINRKIESKRKNCGDYMMRGFIYKKLNQPQKAQKDFEQAQALCNTDVVKDISTNDNYYKEVFAQKKKQYKF